MFLLNPKFSGGNQLIKKNNAKAQTSEIQSCRLQMIRKIEEKKERKEKNPGWFTFLIIHVSDYE